MKKIVGIIAALALATAVFADDPGLTPELSKFSGYASIEYDIDLDQKTGAGIVNDGKAEFEVKWISGASKSTSGDGVWGELAIKVGDTKGGACATGAPEITKAQINFVDDDFYANMDIRKPGLKVGGGDIAVATWSAKAFPSATVTLTDAAGFTLNFGLKDKLNFGLQYADNGVVKFDAKKVAFVFTVGTGKDLVEGLNFNAGVGYGTEAKKFVAAATVDYKLGLTDALYIKPAVGFALDESDAKSLSAGLLFGWGAEGQEPGFQSFLSDKAGTAKWDNIPNKCADGVSVYAELPLGNDPAIKFLAGVYDATLVENLKMGAEFYTSNIAKMDTAGWVADVAFKWASGDLLGDWKLSLNAGFEAEKIAEVKTGFLWGLGLENGAIIDNTTLYLNYSGQKAADLQSITKDTVVKGCDILGTIKIGAKISL
jgi:hypothetical protein